MFTIYPPYAGKNSCLRFHALHARQFQCMCPSRLFQRLQHFTTSKSSTGILWYVACDIPQCHKGFVRNFESHNLTSPLVTRVTHQSHNFTSTFTYKSDTRFVRCESHDLTSPLLTPWSTYAFVPALKLPWQFREARFPLEKETACGRGWQHHM